MSGFPNLGLAGNSADAECRARIEGLWWQVAVGLIEAVGIGALKLLFKGFEPFSAPQAQSKTKKQPKKTPPPP
jgi:hypothetical protein